MFKASILAFTSSIFLRLSALSSFGEGFIESSFVFNFSLCCFNIAITKLFFCVTLELNLTGLCSSSSLLAASSWFGLKNGTFNVDDGNLYAGVLESSLGWISTSTDELKLVLWSLPVLLNVKFGFNLFIGWFKTKFERGLYSGISNLGEFVCCVESSLILSNSVFVFKLTLL